MLKSQLVDLHNVDQLEKNVASLPFICILYIAGASLSNHVFDHSSKVNILLSDATCNWGIGKELN